MCLRIRIRIVCMYVCVHVYRKCVATLYVLRVEVPASVRPYVRADRSCVMIAAGGSTGERISFTFRCAPWQYFKARQIKIVHRESSGMSVQRLLEHRSPFKLLVATHMNHTQFLLAHTSPQLRPYQLSVEGARASVSSAGGTPAVEQ